MRKNSTIVFVIILSSVTYTIPIEDSVQRGEDYVFSTRKYCMQLAVRGTSCGCECVCAVRDSVTVTKLMWGCIVCVCMCVPCVRVCVCV